MVPVSAFPSAVPYFFVPLRKTSADRGASRLGVPLREASGHAKLRVGSSNPNEPQVSGIIHRVRSLRDQLGYARVSFVAKGVARKRLPETCRIFVRRFNFARFPVFILRLRRRFNDRTGRVQPLCRRGPRIGKHCEPDFLPRRPPMREPKLPDFLGNRAAVFSTSMFFRRRIIAAFGHRAKSLDLEDSLQCRKGCLVGRHDVEAVTP